MDIEWGFWTNRGGLSHPLNTDKRFDSWFYYDKDGKSGIGSLFQTKNRHYGFRFLWRGL